MMLLTVQLEKSIDTYLHIKNKIVDFQWLTVCSNKT